MMEKLEHLIGEVIWPNLGWLMVAVVVAAGALGLIVLPESEPVPVLRSGSDEACLSAESCEMAP